MNEHPRHLDRETAEQMLDGASPAHAAGAERLARLLAAAGGPPRSYEYDREEEAIMAFRSREVPKRRALSWRNLLTFKVLATTATITVGGLAFASTAGILPDPFNQEPGVSPTTAVTSTVPRRSGGASPTGLPSAAPGAEVPPGINGLCTSYLNKDAKERSEALQQPHYAQLISAAGGAENIEAYCSQLPLGPGKPPKTHEPTPPPRPTPEPNPPRASRK